MSEKREQPVTHDEARQILYRFCNSHFNLGADRARVSIPADVNRDDDLLMWQYIDEQETLTRELVEARSQRSALLPWVHVWDDRNHCRQCDGHGRHLPDCKLKAALDAAKGGA